MPRIEEAVALELEPARDGVAHHDLEHRAARGAVSVIARGIAVRAIGMLGNLVIARMMSPREFGMVALGLSVMTAAGFLASGGLGSALINRPGEVPREGLRIVLGLQVAMSLAATLAAVVAALFFGEVMWLAALMVGSLIIDSVRVPNGILLERTMDYQPLVRAEVAETLMWNVWAVAAVALGAGVWGVATAQIARAVVGAGLILVLGPIGLIAPSFRFRRAADLLKFGLKFQGVAVVQLVRDQGFNAVVAAAGGLTVLGLWSIVVRLTTIIGVVLESVWRVSFPAMSRVLETARDPAPLLGRALRHASLATGLLVSPLVGCAPALINVLFGSRWAHAADAMPAAGAAIVIGGPVIAVAFGYFMAAGRSTFLLVMSIADALTLFAVGALLTPFLHLTGTSLAMLAFGTVQAGFLGWALRRDVGLSIVREAGVPVLAAALSAAASWMVVKALGTDLVALLGGAATAVVIYGAVLALLAPALLRDAVLVARRTAAKPSHAMA